MNVIFGKLSEDCALRCWFAFNAPNMPEGFTATVQETPPTMPERPWPRNTRVVVHEASGNRDTEMSVLLDSVWSDWGDGYREENVHAEIAKLLDDYQQKVRDFQAENKRYRFRQEAAAQAEWAFLYAEECIKRVTQE
jgi:uncharacterized protein YdaU (DUF1376 family)